MFFSLELYERCSQIKIWVCKYRIYHYITILIFSFVLPDFWKKERTCGLETEHLFYKTRHIVFITQAIRAIHGFQVL